MCESGEWTFGEPSRRLERSMHEVPRFFICLDVDCFRLRDYAYANGSKDNISVMLIHNGVVTQYHFHFQKKY